jgi:nicotinic acid mononucleotide adenylyltransferase
MDFFHRAATRPHRLGILPGAFNPITTAHLALARAALEKVDEVLFVLPRVFPHKGFSGAKFSDRMCILCAAIAEYDAFSAAASDGGLFRDIARECREHYDPGIPVSILCGRDAAERIVNWPYPEPDACAGMLREFDLLVAARQGEYQPPPQFAHAIRPLLLSDHCDDISSSEVRERIARGDPWEHLVPPPAHNPVRQVYTSQNL